MRRLLNHNIIKKEREGSTLVSVVIGVLFLAAIGIIVLTAANSYMISVNVDYNSSNNFYEAEQILEEVKTGLLEYAGDASEDAYKYILQHYGTDKNSKREAFSKKYLSLLADKLQSKPSGSFVLDDSKIGEAQAGDIQKLKALSQVPDAVTTVNGTNLAFVIKKDSETGEYSLVIRNTLIDFTNEIDYRSTIQTDICLTVPDHSLEGNSTFDEMKDYISISDDTLGINNGLQNIGITGKIYGGNTEQGILLGQKSKVDFKSPLIISRGDMEVHNGAEVSVTGETGVGDLYLQNIHLTAGGSTDSTQETKLTLNENAYIADDLNIETNNSTVTLKGKYYGYSYNADNSTGSSAVVNSNYSSAILINGKNTTLRTNEDGGTTNGLHSLVLAGRAFVSRQKQQGVSGPPPVSDIRMGESIAVKSNQLAYLVPDEFIVTASGNSDDCHNPVLKDEMGEVHVDEAGLKNKFGQYLNETTPYEANYNNTLGYVFYYLKFKDDIAANKYFEAYYNGTEVDEDGNTIVNKEELQKKGKVYISDKDLNIKFDPMLYLVAGNVINNYYNANGTSLQKATYFGDNQQPELRLLEEGQRIGQKYVGYQLGLTPSKNTEGNMRLSSEEPPPRLVSETIVNFQDSEFKKKVTEAETVKTEADTGVSGAVLRICKGDYTVPSEMGGMKGLLVVDGDVTVSADFTGLILATGKVTVADNNSIKMQSDMVTVGKLFDYIRTDEALSSLFRDLNGTLKKRPSDLAECISYQNWVKNSY